MTDIETTTKTSQRPRVHLSYSAWSYIHGHVYKNAEQRLLAYGAYTWLLTSYFSDLPDDVKQLHNIY